MKTNLNHSLRELQKQVAGKSLKAFASTYFKHYTKLPFSQFHLELIEYLQKVTFERNGKLAIAAPRGYAKSSIISLFYPLWCICFGYESCIVLCSSTENLSQKLLSHVKDELSTNEDIKLDFPEVSEPPNPRWRNDEIITKNKVNVMVTSVGKKIRGIRHQENRPGLIILDDVENNEAVRSAESREKLEEWFTKVILNLGFEKSNYIVVGTILHFDSLLAKLTTGEELAGWKTLMYKAIKRFADRQDLWDQWAKVYRNRENYDGQMGPEAADKYFTNNKETMLKGSEVLWEVKESYCDLMLIREQKGEAAFLSEKMNEPKSYEAIDINSITFWDKDGISIDILLKSLKNKVIVGSCDPAISLKPTSDYSAIISGVWDMAENIFYVIDADAGRWGFEGLVNQIKIRHEIRNYVKFIYEANQAQAWLGNEIVKQCQLLPLEPLISKESKDVRIMRLVLLIKQGTVRMSRKLEELNRQITQYPYCAHDDLIDALSMLTDRNGINTIDIKKAQDTLKLIKEHQQRAALANGQPFTINDMLKGAMNGKFCKGMTLYR